MVCEDKRKIIAYLWYLNAILSVAYVIVAIAAAANQKDLESAETNHAAGFAAIWSMLILFLIIVGGTITMKRVCVCV
jgi:succinate dehydrogenase hydrophobic anchor subunit